MKTLTIFALSIAISIFSMAQQPGKVVNTVKGKVITAATNEPISYTNIGLEGTFYGTASDEEGNFELKIPQELASKDIFFSAVGFKNKKFPVKSLFDKEFSVIKMGSQSYGIDNVNIAAQNKVLIRILRMASENIPYNYIQGPYNLAATYSCEKTIADSVQKVNAEVLIFDKSGYVNPSKDNAYRSLKYSLQKEVSDEGYRFSTGTSNLDELLEIDWVRTAASVLNPNLTNGFQLKLEDEPSENGANFWVISFSQKTPTLVGSGDFYATAFKGLIKINKEDYSVVEIKVQVESPKNNRQGKALAIGATNSNYLENMRSNFSIQYKDQKPLIIEMDKAYVSNGESISEKSSLKINQARANNLTELDSRQYFTGK
jgi:hypothetical protein